MMSTAIKVGDLVRINCPGSSTNGAMGVVTHDDRHLTGGGITVKANGETRTWAAVNVEPIWTTLPSELVGRMGNLLTRQAVDNETEDLPRELVQGFIDYLSEDLGCDHEVGICMCAEQQLVHELKLGMDGERVCPACGGEGIEFDQELYAAEEADAMEGGYDIDPMGGYVTCSRCDGKGGVAVK